MPLIVQDIIKDDLACVQKYGRTYGHFLGSTPSINTADVDLIKSILIKDFHHFVNRRVGS